MFRVELSSERVKGMRVTQEAFPSSSLLQQLSLRELSSSLFNIALGFFETPTRQYSADHPPLFRCDVMSLIFENGGRTVVLEIDRHRKRSTNTPPHLMPLTDLVIRRGSRFARAAAAPYPLTA